MRASNVIYEVDEARSFWKLRPLQLLVTLLCILLLAITIVALVASRSACQGDRRGDRCQRPGRDRLEPGEVARPAGGRPDDHRRALLRVPERRACRGFRWITPRRGAGRGPVDRRVAGIRVLRRELRLVRQDLRHSRRGRDGRLVWLWITNVAILLGAELNAAAWNAAVSWPPACPMPNRSCSCPSATDDAGRLSPVCSRRQLPEIRYDLQTFTGRRPASSGAQRRPAEGSGVGSASGEASRRPGGRIPPLEIRRARARARELAQRASRLREAAASSAFAQVPR